MTKPHTLLVNDGLYGDNSYVSSWVDVSEHNVLNIYCSAKCDIHVEMCDEEQRVEEVKSVQAANDTFREVLKPGCRRLRVSLRNIAKQACALITQFIVSVER